MLSNIIYRMLLLSRAQSFMGCFYFHLRKHFLSFCVKHTAVVTPVIMAGSLKAGAAMALCGFVLVSAIE